jgi:hypothetical protein
MCDAEWREKIEKKLEDISAGIDMLIATDNARNKQAINNRGNVKGLQKQLGTLLLKNPLIANNPALLNQIQPLLEGENDEH